MDSEPHGRLERYYIGPHWKFHVQWQRYGTFVNRAICVGAFLRIDEVRHEVEGRNINTLGTADEDGAVGRTWTR